MQSPEFTLNFLLERVHDVYTVWSKQGGDIQDLRGKIDQLRKEFSTVESLTEELLLGGCPVGHGADESMMDLKEFFLEASTRNVRLSPNESETDESKVTLLSNEALFQLPFLAMVILSISKGEPEAAPRRTRPTCR